MTICIECKADLILVRKLIDRNNIIHSGNKSSVLYDLVNNYSSSKGMVDADPGKPVSRLINRFQEVRNHHAQNIRVLYDNTRDNYLISLWEDLEDWILNICRICGVNTSAYGLPDSRDRLHKVITHNLDKFEVLLDVLMPQSSHLQLLQRELLDP